MRRSTLGDRDGQMSDEQRAEWDMETIMTKREWSRMGSDTGAQSGDACGVIMDAPAVILGLEFVLAPCSVLRVHVHIHAHVCRMVLHPLFSPSLARFHPLSSR